MKRLWIVPAVLCSTALASDHPRTLGDDVRLLLAEKIIVEAGAIDIGGVHIDLGSGVDVGVHGGGVGVGVGVHGGVRVGEPPSPPLTPSPPPAERLPGREERVRNRVDILSADQKAVLKTLCQRVKELSITPDPNEPVDADLIWLCAIVESVLKP